MSIRDKLKEEIKSAMKNRDDVRKDILRVALGEIETAESRKGDELSDAKCLAMINKIVNDIRESYELTKSETIRDRLYAEIAILSSFLPDYMSIAEIVDCIKGDESLCEAVKAADQDGKAIGLARKGLSDKIDAMKGSDIKDAVAHVRNET